MEVYVVLDQLYFNRRTYRSEAFLARCCFMELRRCSKYACEGRSLSRVAVPSRETEISLGRILQTV